MVGWIDDLGITSFPNVDRCSLSYIFVSDSPKNYASIGPIPGSPFILVLKNGNSLIRQNTEKSAEEKSMPKKNSYRLRICILRYGTPED